jgi:hypothetical protein
MPTLKRKNADGHWEYIQVSGLDVSQLKDEVDSVTSSLAAKANQSALDTTNTNVAANTTALSDIMSQVVNVKKPPAPLVGCKGDGVTDDTIAINNIIATVSSPYLYFPTGTYSVQYISFINNIYLFGDGSNKTIIKRVNGYNTSIFDTTHPEKGNLIGNMASPLTSQNNVSIQGICFDGNVQNVVFDATSNLSNMFNNVQIYYMSNLVIKECKFINSIGDGLFLAGNRNTIIENCYFDHCGYNTKPGTNTTQNCMSTFGSYYNGTTQTSSIVETNATIKNCFFNDPKAMGIVSRNVKTLNIEDCEFTLSGDSDLELYGDTQTSGTKFNTFDNKIIIKNNLFTGKVGHGDSNKNYKEVFIFENNIVEDSDGQFFIGGNGTDFDIFVENNKFIVNQVQFANVKRVNLNNNDIQFSGSIGVFFNLCQYPVISENHIFYTGTDTTSTIGLQIYNISTEPVIINNVFASNVISTKECIKFSYTDASTIMIENLRIIGNKISGFNRGINIGSAVNNAILINSNVFDVPTTGGEYCVYQWSVNCKNAVMNGNVFINNSTVNLVATNTRIDNKGSGTSTIVSSATTVTVNHGLSFTPKVVTTTPQGNVGNTWVTGITGSQFVINCSVAPASNTTVSWRAS